MSTTNTLTPITVSVQVGDAHHQIDVEDLYYHSQHPDYSLTIDKAVLDTVESGSSEWINKIPVEITLPYTRMEITDPYLPTVRRFMKAERSQFLNGEPFSGVEGCYEISIYATLKHMYRLQSFLAEINKTALSDSDSGTAITLIEYKDVVFSPYRHHIGGGGGELSITFSDHIGQSGWLNQVIWTRYFRHQLDSEFPEYRTLTNLTDLTITPSQLQAIRNYTAVKIMGFRHLLADVHCRAFKQFRYRDPVTGRRLADAQFWVKPLNREEYLCVQDTYCGWEE